MKTKARVIAFYLPQFYPTPENDEWWEPGFTEWTNVARAKPLFKGHYQPRIPRDLGFYDLRVPETREKQAQLAREAGIEGFCYWHYWFGNGKRLLSEVFQDVVESGKPDFPFCLCWANHSWYQKTWDPKKPNKLLMEQTYPGVEDYKNHFMAMLPAFKDKRYIRNHEGKMVFGIFNSDSFPDIGLFRDTWNDLAKKNGLEGFEFFAFVQGEKRLIKLPKDKFDRIVYDPLYDTLPYIEKKSIKWYLNAIKSRMRIPILKTDYKNYVDTAISRFNKLPHFTPSIGPMWDHSPRSIGRGMILYHNSPKQWERLCKETKDLVERRDDNDTFIFIRAWNEWGEGNYLEPDSKYGKQYIEAAGRVFRKLE